MSSERQPSSPSYRQRTKASQNSFTARCFVPETLIDYINNHVKGELRPASFFLHGVCLLVDISGFTKLSGAFCAQGKDGIDGLQLATNGFMGKLVEIIYSFGGDIIKFAGDAIICIFYAKNRLLEQETKQETKHTVPSPPKDKEPRVDSNSSKESPPQPSHQLSQPLSDNSDKEAPHDLFNVKNDQSFRQLTTGQVPPEIVLKAIRCSLELKNVETSQLTVHVAMSCGEMCFGILGGYEHRFECLISGACLHELSDCLDDAPSKHAALTSQCYDILRVHSQMMALDTKNSSAHDLHKDYDYLAQVQVERLRSGNYMILSAESKDGFSTEFLQESPRSTPLPPLVSHFVPVPISSGMEHTAGLSYLAEIREVTTMFMKWESYDATHKHKDLMTLQGHFHQVQKILHTTGAFLRQFLVDDKGCVLIACWGMPSLSYLDNPHRALSAAAQIRNKFSKSNMKCSIGITTGDVYCGTVGSAVRMEYAAIGNVVNMSARLMGKADEDILIDHETYLRLPDSVSKSLEPMSPMMVKGRDTPLQAYRYSAESSIFIGDDVVEDHEVREVCKTTFIKLLDRMKAPGRFSHYKRRQSIVKMKDWISGSVRRGGDLLTLSTTSNKMNESASRRGSLLRSSFQMSFRGSTRGSTRNNYNEEGTSYRPSPSMKSPRSGTNNIPQRRGSNGGAYASNRNPGVYQHDDSSHRHIHEIPYVLMEGRRGAGKSSIVNWLKKQATDRQIPVYRARLTKNDVVVDYSLWMKVFRQMMPKDMFKTKELQEKYVTQLLTELYHDDLDTIEFVAFPSMKRAFGVNCDLELLNRDKSFDLSFGDTAKPKRKKITVTARVVTETLLKVFAHLLNEKPTLIIVENVQFADEESLNVLLGLTHLHTLSAVVLTALGPDGHSGKKHVPSNGIQRVDSFDSEVPVANDAEPNEWFSRFRGSVLFYDHATLITLDDFTPDEIDRMLCEALNLIQVPAEISQLVQDLSGGSFFWVKEIMHFLQEHGRDEFLVAISGGEVRLPRMSHNGQGITSPRVSQSNNNSTMKFLSQALNFTRKAIMNRIISPQSSLIPTGKTTKFKLELLVVCRFEKLPVNVQHVLRTASIIGPVFPSATLYAVLPPSLQDDVQEYIDALLRQKWIVQDPDDETQYSFTHPYAHKIIYDLTPSSERSNMHQIIADHIEHTTFDDPAQFAVLCHHNTHCNPVKAFHYTYRAITHLLDKGTAHELGQCVDLLFDAVNLCMSVVDADVLRIMSYNVRKKVDELGQAPVADNLASRTANMIGGMFGAALALSSRWHKNSPHRGAQVTPLTVIDEGISGKSTRSARSVTKSTKSNRSGKSSRALDAAGVSLVGSFGPPVTAPPTFSQSISNANSRDDAGAQSYSGLAHSSGFGSGHSNTGAHMIVDLGSLSRDFPNHSMQSMSTDPNRIMSQDEADLMSNPCSPNFVSPRSEDTNTNNHNNNNSHLSEGIASGTPRSPHSPVKTPSLKILVKRVIDSNASSTNTTKLEFIFGGGNGSPLNSNKSDRKHANNERAKSYFLEKLRQLDTLVDIKVNEFTIAGKFGEHQDWQHTLILCTPKKDLPNPASPARFFVKAGSATKQFFAPFFRPSDAQLSVNEEKGSLNGGDMSQISHVAEPGNPNDMSMATNQPNTSVSRLEL